MAHTVPMPQSEKEASEDSHRQTVAKAKESYRADQNKKQKVAY